MALVDDLSSQLEAELESGVGRALSAERARAAAEADRLVSAERERLESQLAAERTRAQTEFARAVAEERTRAEDSRLRFSESLNQTLRRIRRSSAEHEVLQLLLEESPAQRAVVLLIENNQARIGASRGVTFPEEDNQPPIDLSEAAALASCVESRDLVVALVSPAEISSTLATAFASAPAGSGTETEKAYLFPVTVRQDTVALMVVCGNVMAAPIELLSAAAGMKLESLEAAEASAAGAAAPVQVVQIAAAAAGAAQADARDTTWSKLPPEEQALHLRAQRFARVRVAQIRISESEALRKGLQTNNIYGTLRPAIDAAREEYRRSYLSHSPTMVDYLHLEIVRSLAREDTDKLGEDYPGPIR